MAAGPPPCDPELEIQPTAFFGQRILITLPKGVELTERNPFFASATTGGQASSCGAPIAFAAVGYLRSTASLPELRKHVMMLRGFRPEELTFSDEKSLGDTTVTTYAATSEPPLRGLILFKRDRGWYYFSLLEAAEGDFAGLEAMFRASFASLLIRPVRDGA